ncbi:hypothetical protein HMPREF9123_0987 [Neisseria bacilliformis ATCC BAA-1200]|uniref:Uncharacterized protein n=1 Tax=Neisseria bacilliformis ATCC BAA-1200 TaxID=888742 RepID=F2BB83_9NEIS|nr:hypothetical protein HMPREF9123_0987 [Neisseria bacilliformis ATCC BAA-1200]
MCGYQTASNAACGLRKRHARVLGSVDNQLASGFLSKKCPNARKKAQQGWTPCEHF